MPNIMREEATFIESDMYLLAMYICLTISLQIKVPSCNVEETLFF